MCARSPRIDKQQIKIFTSKGKIEKNRFERKKNENM